MGLDIAFWVETERRKILVRDNYKILPEWMGFGEYLGFFRVCLNFSFYASARVIADYLLRQEVPITTIRATAYPYFEGLGIEKKTKDRLELAFLCP